MPLPPNFPQPPVQAGRVRGILLASAGVAATACLAAIFTYPLVARMDSAVPLGDSWFNAWLLAWGADRIPHGLAGYWSPPVFYPYANTLAYSETLLGVAVLVAPVQWIAGNPVLTYNVALLASFVLAAAGMFLLARDLTGDRLAAAVGALAFAFSPYRTAQLAHLQVLMCGWFPLTLWSLHRFFARGRTRYLLLSAACFVMQATSNGYSLVIVPFAIVPVALWEWWRQERSARWRLAKVGLLAAAGAVVVLMPVIGTYRAAWRHVPTDGLATAFYSADASTYLAVDASLPGSRWLPGVRQPEGNFFPGFLMAALAICALAPGARRRQPAPGRLPAAEWHAPYLVVAVIGLVLSLGPRPAAWGHPLGIPGPYTLLQFLPGMNIVRVPARFGMLVMLPAALFAGAGAGRLLRAWPPLLRMAALVAAVTVSMVEATPAAATLAPERAPATASAASIYTALAALPPGAVLELPLVNAADYDHGLDYQFGALYHHHPLVNGVSRRTTPLLDLLGGSAFPLARADLVEAAVNPLRALGVRYVVVTPGAYRDRTVGDRTLQGLRTSPHAETRAHNGDTWLFSLAAWSQEREPSGGSLEPVPAASVHVAASVNAGRVPRMLDGRLETRWLSGGPQAGAEWIELVFDTPRAVARLDLVAADRSLRDYPRRLVVETAGPGQAGEATWDGDGLCALMAGVRGDPEGPAIRVPLDGRPVSRVTIRQTGRSERWYWSVDEIRVWERRAGRR